jgi:hypothetical protein
MKIHIHFVFPFEYRKALIDEEATDIIKEPPASIKETKTFEI